MGQKMKGLSRGSQINYFLCHSYPMPMKYNIPHNIPSHRQRSARFEATEQPARTHRRGVRNQRGRMNTPRSLNEASARTTYGSGGKSNKKILEGTMKGLLLKREQSI